MSDQTNDYLERYLKAFDSVHLAGELGRLDFITIVLAILAVLLAILAIVTIVGFFPLFRYLQMRNDKQIAETIQSVQIQMQDEIYKKVTDSVSARMETMLPNIINDFVKSNTDKFAPPTAFTDDSKDKKEQKNDV